jgi:uncharacterized membrane protein
MDDLSIGLIILLVLAVPVLAIAAFVIALGQRTKLRSLTARVAELDARLRLLSQQPPSREAAPSPVAAPASAAAPVTTEPPATTPPAQPAPKPTSVPPTSAMPAPAKRRSGFEEALGAKVAVWVGGLALALGGVFLVRYSIEQGLLGPGARVTFGALFALALLAGGEWLRRNERTSPVGGVPAAHVPGILTAAGTSTAFAVVYAAYALYGFLSPALAFVVLALVSIGTMLAAALHGPILAGLGLVAATALPALVSTGEPNAWGLFGHLAFVSASAFGVARIRGWNWLVIAASAASFGWGALYVIMENSAGSSTALAAFAAAFLGLAGAYHATAPRREEDAQLPDWTSTGIAAAFGLFAVASALVTNHGTASLVLMALLIAGVLALAVWRPRLAPLVAAAAALALLGIFTFDLAPWLLTDPTTAFPMLGEPGALPSRVGTLISLSLVLATLVAFVGLGLAWREPARRLWITGARAGGAVAAPLALLATVYWKVAALAPDLRFAGTAVLLAGLFALLTDRFARREPDHPALMAATAATATGAVAAIGLAMAMGMREGILTVSLAVLVLGIAWIHGSRRVSALPVLATIVGAVVLLRTGLDPLLVDHGVGTTPIFNAILWCYGVPAAAFAASAWLFGRQDAPRATALCEGLALLYTALLLAFEIRHFSTGGVMAGESVFLAEVGLQVMTGCLIALAAQRLSLTRPGSVLRLGSMVLGLVSMAGGVLGLLLVVNPLFTRDSIGNGLIFNDLIPGYLLPALAAGALCVFSRHRRPSWYVLSAGVLSGLLAFALVSLEVRAAYHRPILSAGYTTAGESYAYSVVWLLCGVLILLAGAVTKSRELRLGSAAVITLTVLKVFLLDMNGLEGVLRALSFMGLGLALVGIGLLYQRLLFPAPKD